MEEMTSWLLRFPLNSLMEKEATKSYCPPSSISSRAEKRRISEAQSAACIFKCSRFFPMAAMLSGENPLIKKRGSSFSCPKGCIRSNCSARPISACASAISSSYWHTGTNTLSGYFSFKKFSTSRWASARFSRLIVSPAAISCPPKRS